MDAWLLGLFLGYKNLPDRAAELWDLMKEKRSEIAWEEMHLKREPVLSDLYNQLTPLELEFRALLVAQESKAIQKPKQKRGSRK